MLIHVFSFMNLSEKYGIIVMRCFQMKKYMFFDIDGTLTCPKSSEIPESTIDTLKRLKEKGHVLAIATGRPYPMVKDVAKLAGIDYIVCNGGNAIYKDGECYLDLPLDKDDCMYLFEECEKNNISYAFVNAVEMNCYTKDEQFEKDIKGDFFIGNIMIQKDLDYRKVDNFFRLFIAVTKEQEEKLNGLKKLVGSRYHDHYIIVEPDDKYHGIERMMDLLHAPIEDVVVFGDGKNDIRMFQSAPASIAMGNAIEELKDMATFVTKDSDQDGIEYACKEFGWL